MGKLTLRTWLHGLMIRRIPRTRFLFCSGLSRVFRLSTSLSSTIAAPRSKKPSTMLRYRSRDADTGRAESAAAAAAAAAAEQPEARTPPAPRIHLRMSKQQKIHVFLGAPSPPLTRLSVWTWAGECGPLSRWVETPGAHLDGWTAPACKGGGDHMSTGPGHAPSEADWTTEASQPPFLHPKVEEGGVVLETTADGVLCSQEAEPKAASYSPAKSPDVKRTRVSEDARVDMPPHGAAAGLRGPTTLLVRCQRPGARCSVLVAVVHPCHLKEVQVRSGPSAGTTVPLASIVVTDQSAVEMKVVLWRRAAFWVLTVSPGDILLITGLQVSEDRWRGETLLQSTFSSKLLTLGQVAASISPPVPQHVDARSLSALCEYLRERRPLLVSLPRHPPQDLTRLPYATLRSLKVNTLVHALLRVTHTHMSSALVWDFHVLLVREGLTSDLPELHSTPWSSVRPLDRSDRRALDFIAPIHRQTGSSSTVELDLDTLLSQRHSGESQVVSVVSPGLCLQHDITVTRVLPPSQGEVELRVHVTSFHFQDAPSSQNAPQPVLDSSTPLDDGGGAER
ncbi:hypothetical protein INR49_020750 [Caranx melampygus]|nr:hypothetical protein INR49_020750 [Caranx melampygus]